MTSPRLLRHSGITAPAALLLCVLGLLLPALGVYRAQAQYAGPPTNADQSNVLTPTTDQTLLFPQTPDMQLNAGDEISVHLFGETDYTFTGQISVDGTVLLPLIGIVRLQGLTVIQAEQLIAQDLESAGMYRNPQVTLQLTPGVNASVTLGGELHAVVPVVGSRSLYSAIAAGGGLPNTASRTVTILRPNRAKPIQVDIGNDPLHSASSNIPVFPGDTVLVSRIGVVYVAGEFRTPGTVQMTNYSPLTLSQVSAMVGGPVWDARYNQLHIIRTVGDHRTVTTLNIKDVLYGKKADPIMQPNDIVFLPPSPIKSSLSNGSLGSVLGVLSFALATFYSLR